MSVSDEEKNSCLNMYACSKQILSVQTLTVEQWSLNVYIKKELQD